MQTSYKLALAVSVGVAIGAAAIEGLHAQAKPPAYVVVAIRSINDAAAFKAGVVDNHNSSSEVVAAAGGRYVVRTQDITSLDGPSPQRFVMIAFDSREQAMAWQNSPGTKEITAARTKSTDSSSFLVEGLAK